jgi:hypothetical protein
MMLSRRAWLVRLLTSAGAAGLIGRGWAAGPTPGKVSKDVAKYHDRPNKMQMCGMCKFYIPPGGKAGSGMMGAQMGRG